MMISINNINGISDSAVISEGKNINHHELSKIISNTAAKYFTKGIKQGDRVAILSENSLAYVVTVFALWRINAIPIPLNIRLKEEELRNLIDFSEAKYLLKSERFSNYLVDKFSIILTVEFEECSIEYKNETEKDDIAVILFTSGSSGKPKGVEITNSNLYESYLNTTSEYSFTSNDRFLASLPFYHIGGFSIITRSILSGGTLIIPNTLKNDALAESFQKHDPTIISLVPTMLKRLIEEGIKPNKNLRLTFIGGGPSDNSLVREAIDFGWPFVKVYGSTETCSMVSGISGSRLKDNPSCGGKAFQNVNIKILKDSFEEASPFEIGEISVKSKSIAKGYLNNKEQGDQKIYNDHYLTGDFGYLDEDGYLFVVSRRTDLIISGGENIDPSEVEKVLLNHPLITDVVVFPVTDKEWGQIPVAAIVLKDDDEQKKHQIISILEDQLASFKIPKKLFFVNELNRNELGKIDLAKVKTELNLD